MNGKADVLLPFLFIDVSMPLLQRYEYDDEWEVNADVAHADQDVREEPWAKGVIRLRHLLVVDAPVNDARNWHENEGGAV